MNQLSPSPGLRPPSPPRDGVRGGLDSQTSFMIRWPGVIKPGTIINDIVFHRRCNCAALRYDRWKISFLKQDAHGLDVWRIPFVELRAPMICDLLADPFERAERDGMGYTSRNGCKASANSRRARSPAASTSTA